MSEFPREVIDEHGVVHRLDVEPLGRGGQGAVFRTFNPRIVVKLLTSAMGDAPLRKEETVVDRLTRMAGVAPALGDGARQDLRRRLETLRTLPIPEDLPLARPEAMLHTYAGYVMPFLSGMVPIRSLLPSGATQDLGAFYHEGGGLRRRLRLLSRTASILARLHAIPLAYADLSPNNVFVSKDSDADEVWFIDADNLQFRTGLESSPYTPGYGAPEIVRGSGGATTLSDAFSFAVLAFHVLAQVHPFLGDAVQEAGWDETKKAGQDREAMAFAGEFPWIDDPEDDSNQSTQGIHPRDLIISHRMRELFNLALGKGRMQPAARPSLQEWVDVLAQAADVTLRCPTCQGTRYATRQQCPWCSDTTSPSYLFAQVRRWDSEVDEDTPMAGTRAVWNLVIDAQDKVAEVRRHALVPSLLRDKDPPLLRVEILRSGLRLTPLVDLPFTVVGRDVIGSPLALRESKLLPRPVPGHELHLHVGDMEMPHRVATLCLYGGA